jgi:folate-binding protein YgfZ
MSAPIDPAFDPNFDQAFQQVSAECGLGPVAEAQPIVLVGEHTRRWTNGMFTNNTKRLGPGQGNRHAICDDRGRVGGLLDLYLIEPTRFLLVLEGLRAEDFEKRFEMHLVLDDIDVERPERLVYTLQGPTAAAALAAAGLPVPTADHAHLALHPHAELSSATGLETLRICRKDRTGLGGFDLLIAPDALPLLRERLAGVAELSPPVLDALRIRAGRPAWPAEAAGRAPLVHELGLEAECCAFDKGCYVGQEVLNRVDLRGNLNRHLRTVEGHGGAPPVGTPLQLETEEVGTLTSVAPQPGGTWRGLATLRKPAWGSGTRLRAGMSGEFSEEHGWVHVL